MFTISQRTIKAIMPNIYRFKLLIENILRLLQEGRDLERVKGIRTTSTRSLKDLNIGS